MEGGEEGDCELHMSLHCHHQNGPCIKMGSDESHFNVSLVVRDITVLKPWTYIAMDLSLSLSIYIYIYIHTRIYRSMTQATGVRRCE